MISVVVGDDHPIFLDALASVLERQGFSVTAARTVPQTVSAVSRQRPDVCLVDRHFAGQDSVAAIGDMLAASEETRVLVLSADPDTEGVLAALRAGSSGYLHKTREVSALTAAIKRVLRGEVVVDVPTAAPSRRRVEEDHARRLAAFLTARERQCLALLVEGLDTAQMARRLDVSRATVRTHAQALISKLGVHSRLEAASLAVRHRLVDEEVEPVSAARAG